MLARFLMIFAVMFVVSACESTDDAAMEEQATVGTEQSTALNDIYGDGQQGAAPGTQADFVVNVGDRIFFGYDQYDLTQEARDTLGRQATWLNQYSNLRVTVEGHADERGTREYNLALGERRANSVKNYLVALGVDAGRVTTVSYGKERPAVPGSNETSWAQNRRGVTVVE
jgi:peptidoglycan-associated lipoprotein